MGVNSWKGFQSWLRIYGYGGPVDGIPGTNTYRAIQEYARQTGFYSGPVDGVMGPNSWWGLTRSLHATFYNQ
ncbi:peptidoglycan-binding domain-containing protein [Agromyces laixinhei]